MGCEERRNCVFGLHLSQPSVLCLFVFGDICYTHVAGNVFLGLARSVLSSWEAVLVPTHTVFIKLQLQGYWDMCCIVCFIRVSSHSLDFMDVWMCVYMCPSNKRATTVASHHRNSLEQMLTTYILCAWKNSTLPKSNYHQPCFSVQQTGFGLWALHHWKCSSSTHYHLPASGRNSFSLFFELVVFLFWCLMFLKRDKQAPYQSVKTLDCNMNKSKICTRGRANLAEKKLFDFSLSSH